MLEGTKSDFEHYSSSCAYSPCLAPRLSHSLLAMAIVSSEAGVETLSAECSDVCLTWLQTGRRSSSRGPDVIIIPAKSGIYLPILGVEGIDTSTTYF